tara:strand:+ start:2563 stop:2838 length:276 start_codon:yes stop_codon:yes gene_type:complete
MSSQTTPTAATDADGNTYEVFTNPHIEGRFFIEMTKEEGENTTIEGKQYRGRTTGGQITGTTGSDYMTYAPTVCVTVFVDITDAGMTYTYA